MPDPAEGRSLSDRPERHDPLTCELCHGEGVSAELVSLRAENVAMLDALERYAGHHETCSRLSGAPDCDCEFDETYTEIRAAARSRAASDDKQPAPSGCLSVGREPECEHCYQDGRCLSEPCPRPPKYPRGYDEDADREWDEWEALKATLPSPRKDETK